MATAGTAEVPDFALKSAVLGGGLTPACSRSNCYASFGLKPHVPVQKSATQVRGSQSGHRVPGFLQPRALPQESCEKHEGFQAEDKKEHSQGISQTSQSFTIASGDTNNC